jgi:hypothetical protein
MWNFFAGINGGRTGLHCPLSKLVARFICWKPTKTDLLPMTMSVVGRRCGCDDKARQPCVDDAPVSEPIPRDISVQISPSVTKCCAKGHTATVPSSEHMLSIECAPHARYRGQGLTKHIWPSCPLVLWSSGPLAGNRIRLPNWSQSPLVPAIHDSIALLLLLEMPLRATVTCLCVRACVSLFALFYGTMTTRTRKEELSAPRKWQSCIGHQAQACHPLRLRFSTGSGRL